MKTYSLLFVILPVLFTCSNDNSIHIPDETKVIISGKFLAPNATDPIPNAEVIIAQNDVIMATTTTDIDGTFILENVASGMYNLKIRKGLFSAEKTITVDNQNMELPDTTVDDIPKIGVITGNFDFIEAVLYDMGLQDSVTQQPTFDIIYGNFTYSRNQPNANNHRHQDSQKSNTESTTMPDYLLPNVDFDAADLLSSSGLLATYDMIFINCGAIINIATGKQNLADYVTNGGILYVTDWASTFLDQITGGNSDYINFYVPNKSGQSAFTEATIFNNDLYNWLTTNYNIGTNGTVMIYEFLPSWQVVDYSNSVMVTPWLNGPVKYYDANGTMNTGYMDLVFTFPVGNGTVMYSSFHTKNYDLGFSTVDRIMEYFVFEISGLQF